MTTHNEVIEKGKKVFELLRIVAEQSIGEPIPPAGPPVRAPFIVEGRAWAWLVGRAVWLCCAFGRVGRRVAWLANTTTAEDADMRTALLANWNSDLLPLDGWGCKFLMRS